MARKKSSIRAAATEEEREQTYKSFDDILQAAIEQSQNIQAFKGDVFSAEDSLAQLVCLEMPALAPRFLLQSEGWPLGRFIMVDGFQESCKSSFAYEVGTWHRKAGGNVTVIETEQKDATDLRDSFFNYDRRAWSHHRARSQQQWNHAFFYWSTFLKNAMDGVKAKDGNPAMPGFGRTAPFMIMVDSMSSVLVEDQVNQILEDGSPKMNHPIHAKLLADFFRVGTKEIVGYPITFLAINHLKMSSDPRMPHIQVRNLTGGSTPKFQMTTEIELRRTKSGQQMRTHKKYGEVYSIPLEMFVRKNSLAPKESISVEMCWYFDPEDIDPLTMEKRQKSYFDWHSASIDLLIDCMKPGDSGKGLTSARAKALRELIDLNKDGDRRMLTSTTLGIPDTDPLSYYDAGVLLEKKIKTDSEFAHNIYEILGIRRRFMFQPGIDIRKQFVENANRLRAAEQTKAQKMLEEATALAENAEDLFSKSVDDLLGETDDNEPV